jgi:hypothetical protein
MYKKAILLAVFVKMFGISAIQNALFGMAAMFKLHPAPKIHTVYYHMIGVIVSMLATIPNGKYIQTAFSQTLFDILKPKS